MGIQPIDLQTMYSQLSNVSKTISGPQQAQLTEAMQQQNNIQKNLEKTSSVQQTSNEKSTSSGVNSNGHNSSSYQSKNQDNKKDDETENVKKTANKHSYLGQIIDIIQ